VGGKGTFTEMPYADIQLWSQGFAHAPYWWTEMIRRTYLMFTAASVIALAGCDPPPRVELVNGADAAVSITHVPSATLFDGYDKH
jgi:hypothetical protein